MSRRGSRRAAGAGVALEQLLELGQFETLVLDEASWRGPSSQMPLLGVLLEELLGQVALLVEEACEALLQVGRLEVAGDPPAQHRAEGAPAALDAQEAAGGARQTACQQLGRGDLLQAGAGWRRLGGQPAIGVGPGIGIALGARAELGLEIGGRRELRQEIAEAGGAAKPGRGDLHLAAQSALGLGQRRLGQRGPAGVAPSPPPLADRPLPLLQPGLARRRLPVEQLGDVAHEVPEQEGLGQEEVDDRLVLLVEPDHPIVARGEDDGDLRATLPTPDVGHQLVAHHPGQGVVDHEQVRSELQVALEPLRAAGGDGHLVVHVLEVELDGRHEAGIVLHEEDQRTCWRAHVRRRRELVRLSHGVPIRAFAFAGIAGERAQARGPCRGRGHLTACPGRTLTRSPRRVKPAALASLPGRTLTSPAGMAKMSS